MQKVILLASSQDRSRALERLQDLGVMHLLVSDTADDRDLQSAGEELDRIKTLQEMIPDKSGKSGQECATDASFTVQNLWRLKEKREQLQQKIHDLDQELLRVAPFGSFDPQAVRRLRAHGVSLQLFALPVDTDFESPAESVRIETRRDKENVWFAVIGRRPVDRPAFEAALPEKPLAELRQDKEDLKAELASSDQEIAAYAGCREELQTEYDKAWDRYQFQLARSGIKDRGPVSCLEGFVPEKNIAKLRRNSEKEGWGLFLREVKPDDQPPTLIEYPAWVKPVKTVFDLIKVVPGYFETDISVPFLLFLSLFFAM
ncbi:MAG: hypothetical protein K9K64_16585, partial [Desulfohalobiaceae bacterium]|nr:hypothetical protein [Desulfohalobiaceae bacterium]